MPPATTARESFVTVDTVVVSSPFTSGDSAAGSRSFSSPSVGAERMINASPPVAVRGARGRFDRELVDDRGHERAEQRGGRLATGVEAFLG